VTFDMSHLDKEPTRVVCYHGSAVSEMIGIMAGCEGITGEILPMSGGV
jgi:hypothetical protein